MHGNDLLSLSELTLDHAPLVGPKAARLGVMAAEGIPVPDGFCITADVYQRLLGDYVAQQESSRDPREPRSAEDRLDVIRRFADEITLPADLVRAIDERSREMFRGASLAVRSSALGEDSEQASFAGQFHTELGVRTLADVLAAVRRCWASLWNPSATAYRRKFGSEADSVQMAVIVQRLVPANWGGVLFTSSASVDDADASEFAVLVEAVHGSPDRLVEGSLTPDSFELRRQRDEWRVITLNSQDSRSEQPPRKSLEELATFAAKIEDLFELPQDIEWILDDDERVSIVQARPVTAAPPSVAPPPSSEWKSPIREASWARISICDSWLPEPLSPLFETTMFPALVDRWTENWAGRGVVRQRNALVPEPMYGTINGYAYLRSDFRLNEHPIDSLKLIVRWFGFHLSPLWRRWRNDVLPRHRSRIGAINDTDLSALDTSQIIQRLRELESLSAEYWGLIGGLAWYWNVSEWLVARLFDHLVRRGRSASRTQYTELLQGDRTTAWEIELSLARISQAPGGSRDELIAAHRRRFGHIVEQLDFAEPIVADDPDAILEAVGAYLDHVAKPPEDRLRMLAERRARATRKVVESLAGRPLTTSIFFRAVKWARYWSRMRDEALYYFTLAWPRIRASYLELGKRLVNKEVIQEADDVFYLTREELHQLLHDSPAGPDIRGTIAQRRALRAERKRLSPPQLVPESLAIHLGPFDITALALFGDASVEAEGAVLRGSAVSAGFVTGRARVLRAAAEASTLRTGEILVAPSLTPGWTFVLMRAAGVVTDLGGALSHGSIVARELGLPAVMGVTGATAAIRDGDLLSVDGNTGRVTVRRTGG